MEQRLDLVGKQLRRNGASDGCVTCGLGIRNVLTWAHVHPDQGHDLRRVFRLCWTCHRLYDHGLVETAEIVEAENRWVAGHRPVVSAWFAQIGDDAASGARQARPELQHKGAAARAGLTMRRRRAALKAVATRRLRASALP